MRAPRGRSESITLRGGSKATVRTWDHLKGEWRLRKLGEDFFKHQTDRWIARIPPPKTHRRRKNGSHCEKEGWLEATTITEPGEMNFPSSMSEAEQRTEVARRVQARRRNQAGGFRGQQDPGGGRLLCADHL